MQCWMKNLQREFRALCLCIPTPAWVCPTLNQAAWSSPRAWSEVSQEKSTKQHPRIGGLCTKGWSISPPALGWILIQKQSAEPGNSCCLPCNILPGWSHFWKMFFSLNCCPKPEEERKAAEFKAKEPAPCRSKRRREQSCAVGEGHHGVLKVKSKIPDGKFHGLCAQTSKHSEKQNFS